MPAITADDIKALAEQLAAADVITMEGPRETSPDADLRDLRRRWSPAWFIWRSRGGDGEPKSWCATHRGHGREVSMTLMEQTADALERALVRQADRSAIHG